jgi:uncharacterized membrane protein YesL
VTQALRVLGRAVVQFERYGWLYVITNMLSVLLSLPIITIPAAYAALSHLSHTAQTGVTASYADFWAGFKMHFWRGITIGAANVIVLGILWVNFHTYTMQTALPFVALRVAWIIILVVWLGVQLYVWPILEEMEHPTLRGAFRNAAVMMLSNSFYTLILLIAVGIIALISVVVIAPFLLITSSLIACISNAAVLDRLGKIKAASSQG